MSTKKTEGGTDNTGLELENDAAQDGGGSETEKGADSGQSKDKGDKPSKDQGVKMGLARFLQLYPQKSGITLLLKNKNRADVKTKKEWEAAAEAILHKKVS